MRKEHNAIDRALIRKYNEYQDLTGMTQEDLAERTGERQETISRMFGKKGKRQGIDTDFILSFCRALGIRWQDLDVDTGVKKHPRIETLKARLDALPQDDEMLIGMVEGMISGMLDSDSIKSLIKKK